ncbi:MAG: DUF4890 domain-containing protein [Prevotella sp.]|nr:DUF4890 domain-containing protein [Prevotella sp.]
MKKIVLTMVALLSMTAAMAQDNSGERKAPKQPSVEEMTNRMAERLNLTDEQKTKVLALNKEYQDLLKDFRPHRGPRPDGQPGAGPRGGQKDAAPRPDGQTGATPQDGGQKGKRPEMTEEQKAKMKEFQAKREEYDGKMKQILNDDQYQNWKKMQAHRGRPGGSRDGRRPEKPQEN